MYGKKLIRKIGSLVVIATLIASVFVILPNSNSIANGTGIHDVGIDTSYTGAVNGIKIIYNGETINETQHLIIGNEYTIKAKIINLGNFTENVSLCMKVINSTGGVVFGPKNGTRILGEGNYTYFYKDWNTSGLTPGNYTIVVKATIANDTNTSNDMVTRNVVLEEYVPPITLSIVYPAGGEIIGGIIPIKWNASSSSNSKLSIKIEYLNETGAAKLIADNLANTGLYYWNSTGLEKGKQYRIRITATDENGNNISVESGLFTITTMSVTPYMAYYNETKTIDVTGCVGTVKLYAPTAANPVWPSDYELKDQRDGSAGNARFSNVVLDITGPWVIQDEGSNALYYMLVKPIKLNVSVTPSTFNFTKTAEGWVQLTGTVTHNGEGVKGVTVEIWAPGQKAGEGAPLGQATTNTNGSYTLTDIGVLTKGAGDYNITARVGDFSNPNAFGYTIFKVNSVEANVTLVNNTAKGGFNTGMIQFQVADKNGNRILDRYYNISIYKDSKLYAWINNTASGLISNGTIAFDIAGKHLNLTTTSMWETGDYTLKVMADVVGSPAWEYIGSTDFTISPAPKVNLVLLSPDKINVTAPSSNIQTIKVQIFGQNMTTYGNESNGFNMDNITKRISIQGDVLYTPPKDAYSYHGNGIWWIKVFPAYGNGTIYINITWPGKGSADQTVKVVKGGKASVEPTEVIVDKATNITVTVKDSNGNPVPSATVTLYYENGLYTLDDKVDNATITGDGSANKGASGVYKFINVTSTKAATNIIVVADIGYNGLYAYGVIKSKAAHDLNVSLSPSAVLAGEKTKFSVNITKDGKPFDDVGHFLFYILNETQLNKFHNDEIGLSDLTPVAHTRVSEGNYTFYYLQTTPGKYYLYVTTVDRKHDIPSGFEPSFEVTKASVSVSPPKLVKDVDKNITLVFTVTWNGKPVNGTLYLNNITSVTNYENDTIEIVNGKANITGVNATNVGNITFRFKPKGVENEFAPADGMVPIVLPNVEIIAPKDGLAYLGVENVIILQVTHPLTGKGCKGLDIKMNLSGGWQVDAGKTDANGKLVFGVMPFETGNITIKVGNDVVKGERIKVVVGLRINAPSQVEKGKEITIIVTTMSGSPVKGATVKVDGATVGTTDANGMIKYKAEKSGTITITASKEGYHGASISIEITKPPKEQPGFELIGVVIGLFAAILIARRRK